MAANSWAVGLNAEVWKFKGSCGCTPKVYKYQNGNYELKITPTRSKFSVFENTSLKHTGALNEMITYLNTI